MVKNWQHNTKKEQEEQEKKREQEKEKNSNKKASSSCHPLFEAGISRDSELVVGNCQRPHVNRGDINKDLEMVNIIYGNMPM